MEKSFRDRPPMNGKRKADERDILPSKRHKQIEQPLCLSLVRPMRNEGILPNVMDAYSFVNAVSSCNLFMQEAWYISSVLDLVVEIMENHRTSPALALSGIRALSECKYATKPKIPNYIDTIIRAMKNHAEVLVIQEEGFFALRRLTDYYPGKVGEVDRIETIVRAMTYHAEIVELRYLGLDILRVLVQFSAERRANVGTQLVPILGILKDNLKDCWLQQVGLALLSWIVEEEESRDIVIEEGGVLHVLRAMQEHPASATVQCNGSATLCWCIHKNVSDARFLFASQTRGITNILQTMRRYLSNHLIFGNCACILSGLLLADPERDDLEQSKVLKLSIFGMKLHQSSSKVQRNCLTLLRIATTSYHDDDDDEERFLLNHIEIIMHALETYCNDGDLQAEGCAVLANISSSSTTAKEKLSEVGCIETVVNCQVRHKSNAHVQQEALRFHSLLLDGTERRPVTSGFGGGHRHVLDSMIMADPTFGIL